MLIYDLFHTAQSKIERVGRKKKVIRATATLARTCLLASNVDILKDKCMHRERERGSEKIRAGYIILNGKATSTLISVCILNKLH
jgi:hypothetical protein